MIQPYKNVKVCEPDTPFQKQFGVPIDARRNKQCDVTPEKATGYAVFPALNLPASLTVIFRIIQTTPRVAFRARTAYRPPTAAAPVGRVPRSPSGQVTFAQHGMILIGVVQRITHQNQRPRS